MDKLNNFIYSGGLVYPEFQARDNKSNFFVFFFSLKTGDYFNFLDASMF